METTSQLEWMSISPGLQPGVCLFNLQGTVAVVVTVPTALMVVVPLLFCFQETIPLSQLLSCKDIKATKLAITVTTPESTIRTAGGTY